MSDVPYDYLVSYGVPALLIVFAFFIGSWIERRHFRALIRREDELRDVMAFAIRRAPAEMTLLEPHLVCGNAVISVDYFKKFAADLRGIIGGKIGAYESLMERSRREAMLRMKEEAKRSGKNIVLNVKLDSARIYVGSRRGTVSVEAAAYGTAYRSPDDRPEIQ